MEELVKHFVNSLVFSAFILGSFVVHAGSVVVITPPIITVIPTLELEDCTDINVNVLDSVLLDSEACTEVAQANTVIEGDSIRHSTVNTTNRLGSGIQTGLRGQSGSGLAQNASGIQRYSGLAAGDGFSNVSVWGSFTRTRAGDDLISTAYDVSSDNALIGVDFAPLQNMIVGIALSVEQNDVVTRFNQGAQGIDGYTFAPYMGYLISDSVSVDASFGYGRFDIDQTRTDTATSTAVFGNTDSDRWFIAANLNSFTNYNNWLLSGRIGVVYAEEDQDGYAETGSAGAIINTAVASQTVHFGQIQVGGEAAYSFGNLEPFVSAFYENDFKREDVVVNTGQLTPSNDNDDIRLGMGVRYFSSGSFSGTLQWDTILDRTNFDSHSLNLVGRLEF
jgi:hypothetical protein